MSISGNALKFGNNVDTDVILPGRYLVLTDPKDLAQHAMEGLDPAFVEKTKNGVILVAGKNFGCGSSREQAPLALKYAGVRCVLTESFARIFFRNAINIGLPAVQFEKALSKVDEGDELIVDLEAARIRNLTKGEAHRIERLPPFILEILSDGGLIANLRKRMKKE
jgi:3-isopropylmalate/(R)-2-methylmalate dehydratase small subunit